MVGLLLSASANITTPGGGAYGNALQVASAGGHEAVVKLLLDAGAGVNAPNIQNDFGNALRMASAFGHERVVKLLLAAGAVRSD